jgi:malonate-semialdehyde dehydrogenase (acetylating) / methylmalonate-semialdehyde dehydrogenase
MLRRATQPLSKHARSLRYVHSSVPRLTAAAAQQVEWITHHNQVKEPTQTFNFIDNHFHTSKTSRWIDLRDPATQTIVTRVPESTPDEMTAAVDSAQRAFKTWRNTSLLSRQQIMFRLAALIRENWDRLAASITLEQVPPLKQPPLLLLPWILTVSTGQDIPGCQGGCSPRSPSR